MLYEKNNISDNSASHPLTANKIEYSTHDADAKRILRFRIVLANILKYAIPQFRELSVKEIEDRIPKSTLPNSDLFVKEENSEDTDDRKHINFDVLLPVNNASGTSVDIWCDFEPQNSYKQLAADGSSSYDLSARGVYYLSRMVSRQLQSVKGSADYGNLKKCYSIWICFDHLNDKDWVPTVSRYRFQPVVDSETDDPPVRERKAADLMELLIIRAGGIECACNPLIDLINTLWRDIDRLPEYIPENYEGYCFVQKEATNMCDMREVGRAEGRVQGRAQGKAEGRAQGRAEGKTEGRAEGIIKTGLEFKLSKAQIVQYMMKECGITEKQAEEYYVSIAKSDSGAKGNTE